jgi:hypothetical protein
MSPILKVLQPKPSMAPMPSMAAGSTDTQPLEAKTGIHIATATTDIADWSGHKPPQTCLDDLRQQFIEEYGEDAVVKDVRPVEVLVRRCAMRAECKSAQDAHRLCDDELHAILT